MKLRGQIRAVTKSTFFQAATVLHVFDTTLRDDLNALYVEVSGSSINHLQMLQKAAAPPLTGTCKHEHISPSFCRAPLAAHLFENPF